MFDRFLLELYPKNIHLAIAVKQKIRMNSFNEEEERQLVNPKCQLALVIKNRHKVPYLLKINIPFVFHQGYGYHHTSLSLNPTTSEFGPICPINIERAVKTSAFNVFTLDNSALSYMVIEI